MRKSLLSLLVLFVYSLVAFAQQGTEITWTGSSDWSGVAEKAQQISLARGDWSIQASREGGATNPTVNADSKDLRAYAKNLVMVGNDAENIGKLVFHISAQGKKRWADITISEGTITHDTDNGVIIWEAGDADVQYVMLTVGDKATYGTEGATKAGQFDFTSVTAYTKAELTVTEPEPDPVPVLLTSVTPAMTEELTALPEEVVFTFEKDVQEVTSVRLRHNGWGGMRGTELVGEEGLVVTDGATVTVNVPASLVQGVNQMSLTLMGTAVDGGALTDGENGEQVVVQYQYTPNPARYVFTEANPADSSTVEKLDSIIVTFQHPAEGLTGGFAKDVVLNVLSEDSTVVTTATIDFDMATNDGFNSNALITLAEPVTTNGTYTITVPEATVFDDKFNEMFEDYGVADFGAIYNPEFTLTYTVEGEEVDTAATFMYETVSPENGSTVNRLDVITLHFPDNIPAMDYEYPVTVYNEAGDSITNATLYWAYYPSGDVTLTLTNPITTAGTYTLTVDEGMIWNSKLNTEADDYGVSTGAKYNPEFTLTYTVEEAPFEEYPVNFDKDAYQTHSERILNSITLTAGSGEEQTVSLDGTKKAYQDLTDQTFTIASGDQVTVQANYSGEWMHTYVYVDLDNDKQFSFNNGADQTGTELLGWTYIAGYNNEGVAKGQNVNPNTPMTFTVNAEPGEYRMRVKIDWDNQDPGGCVLSSNHILNNGGHIVDVTLVVTAGTGINAATLDKNAKVYTLDGRRVIVNGKLNRGFYIINGQKTFVK